MTMSNSEVDEFVKVVRALNARQWAVLEYFGNPTRDNLDALSAFSGSDTPTKTALRRRGLLEHCDTWPFMRTTTAGGLARAMKEGL